MPAMTTQPDPGNVEQIPAHPRQRDHSTVDTSITATAPMRCLT